MNTSLTLSEISEKSEELKESIKQLLIAYYKETGIKPTIYADIETFTALNPDTLKGLTVATKANVQISADILL